MGLLTGFEKLLRPAEPLAMHTWFQLGGPAEYFAEPENVDQLLALLKRCQEESVSFSNHFSVMPLSSGSVLNCH